tara:strand:- start:439 stop:1878 length:1440 start_codon:yes stop_codon:yes gene_type:complete
MAFSERAKKLAHGTTWRPEGVLSEIYKGAAGWSSGSFPVFEPSATGMAFDPGGGSMRPSNDPADKENMMVWREENRRWQQSLAENSREDAAQDLLRRQEDISPQLGDVEFQADTAKYFSEGRPQYSDIRNDPSRVKFIRQKEGAHPDDVYALENFSTLGGFFRHKEAPPESLINTLSDRHGEGPLDTDKLGEWVDGKWKPIHSPHRGSALHAVEDVVTYGGDVHMMPANRNSLFDTEDPFGRTVKADPWETLRHETGHEVSTSYNSFIQWMSENVPGHLSGTLEKRFRDKLGGIENVEAFFNSNDHEELLQRYEDSLLGDAATKEGAKEYLEGKIWHQKFIHGHYITDIRGDKKKIDELSSGFSKDDLQLIEEAHSEAQNKDETWYSSPWWDVGPKEVWGDDWWDISEEKKDALDDLTRAHRSLQRNEEGLERAKVNIKGFLLIPQVYEAQMEGLESLKQSGGLDILSTRNALKRKHGY